MQTHKHSITMMTQSFHFDQFSRNLGTYRKKKVLGIKV